MKFNEKTVFCCVEEISKKTKKTLKIGSDQPDLDQTLSNFC